jgi:hypothetical protein
LMTEIRQIATVVRRNVQEPRTQPVVARASS